MSSVIWYLYEFARKSTLERLAAAKSKHEIMETPSRFRDYPEVRKEYCIACGACTAACPAPMAIKLIRTTDTNEKEGRTYPVINTRGCIRCGFCAEVCPTDPKTLLCGENHLIRERFTILPVDKMFVVDESLCIKCGKCIKACSVNAVKQVEGKMEIDQSKCIACSACLEDCPVKGAIKSIFIDHVEEQKRIINLSVATLENRIEEDQYKIRELEPQQLYKFDYPADKLIAEAREIIPDDKLIQDAIEKVINRLNMRIITWDADKCTNCRLCVDECPVGAITYDEDKGVQRDKNKCVRCSTCHQTCPFGVAGFYKAKFLLSEATKLDDSIIHVTVKPSQLPQLPLES